MMSQSRQVEKDRRQASADYVVNLKAEMEIMAVSARLDELRSTEMARLLALREQTQAELQGLRLTVGRLVESLQGKAVPDEGAAESGRA